jgi:uncharacterized protein with ATP-grasp and redox domains
MIVYLTANMGKVQLDYLIVEEPIQEQEEMKIVILFKQTRTDSLKKPHVENQAMYWCFIHKANLRF